MAESSFCLILLKFKKRLLYLSLIHILTVASGDPSISTCIDAGADTILEGRRIGKENLTVMAQKGISYVPCMVNTPEEFSIEHKAVVAEAIKAGVAIGVGTETLPSQPVDGTVALSLIHI